MAGRLLELAGVLHDEPGFAEVVASLKSGQGATLGGIWGSSCALAAAAIEAEPPPCSSSSVSRAGDIDALCDDLALFTATPAEAFPAWETTAAERAVDDQIHGDRLRVLKLPGRPAAEPPRLLVTSIQSLLQPVASPAAASRPDTAASRRRRRPTSMNCSAGSRPAVFRKHARRAIAGRILAARGDRRSCSPPIGTIPCGSNSSAIGSSRSGRFEVASQRSLQPLESPGDHDPQAEAGAARPPHRLSSAAGWFLSIEPEEIQEEARHYLNRVDRPQDFHTTAEVLNDAYRFPSVTAAAISGGTLEATCQLRIESVERFSGDIAESARGTRFGRRRI